MEQRRILIFSTAYFPFVGGAEVAIKEITNRIHTFTFELITAKINKALPSEEVVGNVLVHRVGFGSRWDKMLLPILGTYKVLGIMRERHVDLFWGVMVTFATGVPYIINIFRRKKYKIPIVLTLQEGDSEEYIDTKSFGIMGWLWRIVLSPLLLFLGHTHKTHGASGMIQFAWRLALPRTNHLTVISSYLQRRAEHYGFKGPVSLIPNGVDTRYFTSKNEKDIADIKQVLNKKDNELFLITASRLVEKNALGDVIDALPQLSNVRFVILGEGGLYEELKKKAEQNNVSGQVVFLGYVPHEKLPSYLHASDIFIRPSLSEGLGNSFLEAMAAGLPVIATPVGGIPDFLFDIEEYGDKATGVFCEVHNPESIAFAVKRLIQDVGMRERIAHNGRALVLEKYDWDMIARSMKDTLEQVSSVGK